MKKIKVGVVALRAGRTAHLPRLMRTPGITVVALKTEWSDRMWRRLKAIRLALGKEAAMLKSEANYAVLLLAFITCECVYYFIARAYHVFRPLTQSRREAETRVTSNFSVAVIWNRIFGVLGRQEITVSNRHKVMVIRPSFYDDVVELFGRLDEKWLCDLLLAVCREGKVILDVGAHIGRYTLLCAGKLGISGRVIAVEPDPGNLDILSRNVRLNELGNVQVVGKAISDRDGVVELGIGEDTGTHSIVRESKSARAYVRVRSTTIDSLLSELGVEKVDFVKVDVEGAEKLVLTGAEKTLQERKIDRLACEIHPPHVQPRDIEAFLRAHHFSTLVLNRPWFLSSFVYASLDPFSLGESRGHQVQHPNRPAS
jgi:FkbM family methyltransferase